MVMSGMSTNLENGTGRHSGTSALDLPVAVTFFVDPFASQKTDKTISLRALVPKIRDTVRETKAKLPWLKLARFGDTRTEKKSLRHDGNVLEIHGVEADYDGEQITLARARQVLATAGIAAVLYTSPSHTKEKPRWRVLCPTSKPYPPADRNRFLARVNGLFVGALSTESFVLSQSYFYGRIATSTSHEVITIEGAAIDLAADLDENAIGKPEKPKIEPVYAPAVQLGRPTGCSAYGMVVLESECNNIRTAGEGAKHPTLNKAAYSVGGLVPDHMPEHIAKAALQDALGAIASRCADYEAAKKTLEAAFGAGMAKPRNVPVPRYEQRQAPQVRYADTPDENGEYVRLDEPTTLDEPPGLWEEMATAEPDPAPAAATVRDKTKSFEQEWRAITPSLLHGREVPERRWIVKDWLPKRQVTLNYADGGIGKTLLALQLMAATALGEKWCGLPVEQCPSIGLFSEDDKDELHIRLDGIRRFYCTQFTELDDMVMVDGTGQDNLLVVWDGTALKATRRFEQLREHALDIRAKLIVIDTAATTFGGNEIDRTQVTQFVGTYLTRLAQDIDGAVLLNAHPSVSGMASGNMTSGSTAWNGSARSRWAVTRPDGEDGKPKLDSPERVLTRRKSNGAAAGETIVLEWSEGVFKTPHGAAPAASGPRKDAAEKALMDGLLAASRPLSDSKNASNFAPKIIAASPEGRDFKVAELAEALRNMMSRGDIVVSEYIQNYRTFYQIRPAKGSSK